VNESASSSHPPRNLVGNILRALLSFSLLALLMVRIGPSALVGTLSRLQMWAIPVLVGLFAVFLLIGGVNLWILIQTRKPVPVAALLKSFCVSTSLGMYSPAQVGEFTLVFMLRRHGISIREGLSMQFVDKAITLGAGVILSIVAVKVYLPPQPWLMAFFIMVLGGLVVLSLLVWIPGARNFINRTVIHSRWIIGHYEFFRAASDLFRHHTMALGLNVIITFGRLALGAATIYVAFAAFGRSMSYIDVLLINTLARLTTLIPVSLNGIGVLETTAFYLFRQLGIPGSDTLCAFLVNRIIVYTFGIMVITMASGRVLKEVEAWRRQFRDGKIFNGHGK